ncbi:MAG TPA: DddA-like double-stranded DNA deaminase toxin [Pseudonocardiaceae bacterium]|nr:DddA-like double-stranded DNA deaminase toxin [Pseudonocardiaceae bacterium]
MSIGDLGRELQRIADGLPAATLRQAAESLAQAALTLAQCAEGSTSQEPVDAVAEFTAACRQVTDTLRLVLRAEQAIRSYQRSIGAPAAHAELDTARPRPSPAFSNTQVDRIRAGLPTRMARGGDRSRDSNRKTHGLWFDEHGHSDDVVSGCDADQARVAAILAEMGMDRELTITADVEMKVAARMRERGVRRVTLVINHKVCEGRFGCDRFLPILLPEGCELTVYDVDGKKTYRGGQPPWWKRA